MPNRALLSERGLGSEKMGWRFVGRGHATELKCQWATDQAGHYEKARTDQEFSIQLGP